MRLASRLAVVCLLGLLARPVAAQTSYEFFVLYNGGGSAVLDVGSDDPIGANITPGDDFFWSIAAQGGNVWTVTTGGTFFPFMAFTVDESGTRFGNFTLSLLLDGVEQFAYSQNAAENAYVHLGTNSISLAAGTSWDTMILTYLMTGSDVPDATLTSLLPIFGTPEQNTVFDGRASYGPGLGGDVVPEPATMTLLATGLAGLAAGRRRRTA